MTARTHDIVAFASLITIATINPPDNLNIATVAGALVANIVGALLPDLDQAGNQLWDLTPISGLTGQLGRKIFISHRSISHSLLGLFIIYQILKIAFPLVLNSNYINVNVVFMALMIGYVSHLAADLITREGLPLLFPLKYKFGIPPIRSLRIKTGGFREKFIVFPLALVYILWFIAAYQSEFKILVQKIN